MTGHDKISEIFPICWTLPNRAMCIRWIPNPALSISYLRVYRLIMSYRCNVLQQSTLCDVKKSGNEVLWLSWLGSLKASLLICQLSARSVLKAFDSVRIRALFGTISTSLYSSELLASLGESKHMLWSRVRPGPVRFLRVDRRTGVRWSRCLASLELRVSAMNVCL